MLRHGVGDSEAGHYLLQLLTLYSGEERSICIARKASERLTSSSPLNDRSSALKKRASPRQETRLAAAVDRIMVLWLADTSILNNPKALYASPVPWRRPSCRCTRHCCCCSLLLPLNVNIRHKHQACGLSGTECRSRLHTVICRYLCFPPHGTHGQPTREYQQGVLADAYYSTLSEAASDEASHVSLRRENLINCIRSPSGVSLQ